MTKFSLFSFGSVRRLPLSGFAPALFALSLSLGLLLCNAALFFLDTKTFLLCSLTLCFSDTSLFSLLCSDTLLLGS